MLSAVGTDINNSEVLLGAPVSFVLKCEENVPADGIELVFAEYCEAQLKEISVYEDEQKIFSGVVDEQLFEESEKSYMLIVARSFAALLLDSEAKPMSMFSPSMQDIFNAFLKPCGIQRFEGENRILPGRFTVYKGTSCYSALLSFCKQVYGVAPRVKEKTVYVTPRDYDKRLFISNSGGVPYISLKVNCLRCNLISQINCKTADSEDYSVVISDYDAKFAGITAVRYLNVSPESSASIGDADKIIKSAEEKSYYAEVKCKGFVKDLENAVIEVDSPLCRGEVFRCTQSKYVLSKNNDHTVITLRKKEA